MKCPNCGKQISKTWLSKTGFCPNCEAKLVATRGDKLVAAAPSPKKPKSTPTPAWYLVALFGVIIGGIIGYLRVRDKDRNMALTLLLIGILTTVILIMKLMYVF